MKAYRFPLILLSSILIGGFIGYFMGADAVALKPLGDIFLNLMFTIVVPLVFFSIASSIANMDGLKRLGKIMSSMAGTFLFTSIIAAIFMIIVVKVFPPAHGVVLELTKPDKVANISVADQIVGIFTVSDFAKLLSRENMLALIFFSILMGVATSAVGEKGKPFATFLQSGAEISMKVVSFIMHYAPIGLAAYFAALVGEFGPQLLGTYFRAAMVYYPASIVYFFVAFTFYAYLAGRKQGVQIFWKNMVSPTVTSLATCSSAASIPANLEATKKMGISSDIRETVVLLGSTLHKDGSVLGGVIKIAFLFGIFNMEFSSPKTLAIALVVSLLVGTVMGAIPGGGMIGEMLIVSLYGFPPEALPIIAAISTIIDPPATMLNVTGDNVCAILTARLVEGKDWVKNKLA
ncbi:dicarboxylate/amino acid:cation symporter [Bacillus sp. DX4.1]|uniref:dicarboxylate/amino acid:cation symporter n=1 Tax=Bacillus sp. DX4.1 TaxID=3055867 RepID=UPI0025A13BD8|nr:dicarboxylate/amino acid:cation symporter [Bacillus sp. DX4.1]MDM5190802.1 dicarboxylate/amino acid:cation symporter [Bacillus sp. DX4.1]